MTTDRAGRGWRRGLSLAVAALLTVSALIAVAILLAGEPGDTEGRILGTTALLAGYGILALPASMLLDLGRARAMAGAILAVDAAGAGLAIATIWAPDAPDALGKAAGTAAIVAAAAAQVGALTARRRPADPPLIGRLLVASVVLSAAVVALLSVMIWAESAAGLWRPMAALLVLDLLAAALQPILARARAGVAVRLRVRLAGAPPAEVAAEGRDLAAAVAAGIRRAEAGGGTAVAVDVLERRDTA